MRRERGGERGGGNIALVMAPDGTYLVDNTATALRSRHGEGQGGESLWARCLCRKRAMVIDGTEMEKEARRGPGAGICGSRVR